MNISEYKATISSPLRSATLLFLVNEDKILLAMKKRGFGVGRWNGVGGKLKEGESIEEAALRETEEEIAVKAKNIQKRAILNFYFPNNPSFDQQVTVYFCDEWEGNPQETEEMAPMWYEKNNIPFDSMWPDDDKWLSKVIKGSNVLGYFLFGENDRILDYEVDEVEEI